MRKIMIIDDDERKIGDIKSALENLGETDVAVKHYGSDALLELRRSFDEDAEPYALIFLDMQFVFRKGGRILPNCGQIVLSEIKRRKWPVHVVLDSSGYYYLPGLLGAFVYDSRVDQTENVKKYVQMAYQSQA